MKALSMSLGIVISTGLLLLFQGSSWAGETCTTDGKGNWECVPDDTSTQPSCVGKGPFECSEPGPAGLTSFNQDEMLLALTCKLTEKKVTNGILPIY